MAVTSCARPQRPVVCLVRQIQFLTSQRVSRYQASPVGCRPCANPARFSQQSCTCQHQRLIETRSGSLGSLARVNEASSISDLLPSS